MNQDSFRKRYVYKLVSNFIGFAANVVVAFVVPRSLGPQQYGNFTFLSNFFQSLTGLFDSGASQAFYIKLSQRQKEKGLVKFYWNFIFVILLMTAVFVIGSMFFDKTSLIWPNQQSRFIWMAFFWGSLMLVNRIFESMLDAYGLTVNAQKMSVIQKAVKAGLIFVLFGVGVLNLTTFFIYHYVIMILMLVLWTVLLAQHGIAVYPKEILGKIKTKMYIHEFYDYSAPLFVFAFASFFFGVLDLWLLEKFAGSVQQGFYGLAYKIGSICLLFTASMTPLLMREFSISFDKGDVARMRYQFCRYVPLFYTVTAIISVFFSFQADKISYLLGGKEYTEASMAVALMVFYPIHQTYGQLSNSLLFATGRTKLHRNIGLFQMTVTFFITFILIAPKNLYGLDLGAFGLAVKMIIAQLIGVYVRLWFNTRYLNVSFMKFVFHNVFTVIIIGGLAFVCTYMADFAVSQSAMGSLLISGTTYAVLMIATIYLMPWMVSMSREELVDRGHLIINKVFNPQR